jgi:hypothetical protein
VILVFIIPDSISDISVVGTIFAPTGSVGNFFEGDFSFHGNHIAATPRNLACLPAAGLLFPAF